MISFEWDDARILLAIAEGKNLSRAARILGIHQSTVTRRLQRLETDLGSRIFLRQSGDYAVSSQGKRLLNSCIQARESLQCGLAGFVGPEKGQRKTKAQSLRVTGTPSVVKHLLLSAVRDLRFQNPDCVVSMEESHADYALERRDFDLAFRFDSPPNRAGLMRKRIGQFESRPYSNGASDPRTWIGLDESLSGLPESKWLKKNIERTDIVVRAASYDSAAALASEGLGIALLPAWVARNYPELREVKNMREIRSPGWPYRTLWAVFPEATGKNSNRSFLIEQVEMSIRRL